MKHYTNYYNKQNYRTYDQDFKQYARLQARRAVEDYNDSLFENNALPGGIPRKIRLSLVLTVLILSAIILTIKNNYSAANVEIVQLQE